MNVKIEETWKIQLQEEFNKEYFYKLTQFIKEEYKSHIIYPLPSEIFEAFNCCPFNKLKIVIVGQDPYCRPDQYHGLCFSIKKQSKKLPPSLINISKEMQQDVKKIIPYHGNLTYLAKKGVFLLNSILTVRAYQTNSHKDKGWEIFTNAVINIISNNKENIVFILWGSNAREKARFIDKSKHLILESVHPSPLSAYKGFFGNHHFSKTNQYLKKHNIKPIYW